MRGNPARVGPIALELTRLAHEHKLTFFAAAGAFLEGLVNVQSGAPGVGLEDMRRAIEQMREQNILVPVGKIALAEAEARAGDPDRAIATVDEALATCERLGYRAFEAELHRVRGEILLERDPSTPAPAEEAFLTAIAVAKQQATRSFELRAALALAKLYQSIGRSVDAHAVLAPALEGFSPTPEMPEIAEVQALLAALAESDDVKPAEAQRRRRLQLQTAYSQAMLMARGFAAEETKAAFARVTALSAKTDDFAERFAACHGQWTLALVRGEQRRVRALAFPFLKEAEEAGRVMEACIVHRSLALSCLFSATILEARTHCERALDACDPERDRETRERFTDDTGTLALSCLAVTSWELGEPERARGLINSASRRARELGHAPSRAHPLIWRSHLELLRGDAAAALSAAEALEALGREHGMPFWRVRGELNLGWACGRLHDAAAGAEDLRRALAVSADRGGGGIGCDAWFYNVLLAEARGGDAGRGHRTGAHRRSVGPRGSSPNIAAISPSPIACAAKSCSSAIPPIPHPPRKRSEPLLPSRISKAPAAGVCAPRCRSPGSTNRPAARWRRTTRSRPRSKAFRRRPKCRRSPRRRRCSQSWQRPRKSRPPSCSGSAA